MKLPTDVSGQELIKALVRVGFVVNRVVVPDHKQIRPGTLRQILTEAGLTVEELLELR